MSAQPMTLTELGEVAATFCAIVGVGVMSWIVDADYQAEQARKEGEREAMAGKDKGEEVKFGKEGGGEAAEMEG